jgi:hypothetical protein
MSNTNYLVEACLSTANDLVKYNMAKINDANRDSVMCTIESIIQYKRSTIDKIVEHKLQTTRDIIKNEMRIVDKFTGYEEQQFNEIIRKGTEKINETIKKGMDVINNTKNPTPEEIKEEKAVEEVKEEKPAKKTKAKKAIKKTNAKKVNKAIQTEENSQLLHLFSLKTPINGCFHKRKVTLPCAPFGEMRKCVTWIWLAALAYLVFNIFSC